MQRTNENGTMKNSSDKPKSDSNAIKDVVNKAANVIPKFGSLDKIELSSKAKQSMESVSKFLSKSPRLGQLIAGGTSGWFAGFLTSRVGKTVAAPLGVSVLLIGVASSMGATNLNWEKFGKLTDPYATKAQEKLPPALKPFVLKDGKIEPMFITGFAGGFLLGVAT